MLIGNNKLGNPNGKEKASSHGFSRLNIRGFTEKIKTQALARLGIVDDPKSKVVLLNVFFSFFIKCVNIAVNFLSIPIVLTFLDNTQYGIWLTLTSILGWFSLFDLGFGNGLRNHLTVAILNKDFNEGKIFVSTTYVILTAIFGTILIVFLCVQPFINWPLVFNAPESMSRDLNSAVVFAMCFLFVQLVVRLITTVFLSFQKAALSDFANAVIQIFILAGLYILKLSHHNSLVSVAIVYSVTPVIIFMLLSIYFFANSYSAIRPSLSFFNKKYVDRLLKLGINFFVIQVAALILYASDNFIIAHLFSPADVTVYNVSFKFFSIASVLFTIIISPFWSMVTKSYAQGDVSWIRKSIKNLLILWCLLCFGGFIQLYFSESFYKIWTHDKVIVPFVLSVVICVYTMCATFGAIFSSFLNGIGKIRLQLWVAVASMLINVPMAIFFVKVLHFGIIAVPLATTLCMIVGNTVISIQYRKIVNMRASGIWEK